MRDEAASGSSDMGVGGGVWRCKGSGGVKKCQLSSASSKAEKCLCLCVFCEREEEKEEKGCAGNSSQMDTLVFVL